MAGSGAIASMGLLVVGALAGLVRYAPDWLTASAIGERGRVERAFGHFIAKHGKAYSDEEYEMRFSNFEKAFYYVEAENAKGHSYSVEINQFADRSPDELASAHLGHHPRVMLGSSRLGTFHASGAVLPTAVDWVAQGAVSTPRNQGQCGSCWAFATSGAIEGAWHIASGSLTTLSPQQLLDCVEENSGCVGGGLDAVFQHLEETGGRAVCAEESYAYGAMKDICNEAKCAGAPGGIPAGALVGFQDVAPRDEQALLEAVSRQPVAVGIEADQLAFQLYSNGILTKACGNRLGHGVLIVGYGTENGVDYWKVKNSWGPAWGEQGYVRIERGVSDDGECGIKDIPVFPVVRAVNSSLRTDATVLV